MRAKRTHEGEVLNTEGQLANREDLLSGNQSDVMQETRRRPVPMELDSMRVNETGGSERGTTTTT
jgi:hypothetical protein